MKDIKGTAFISGTTGGPYKYHWQCEHCGIYGEGDLTKLNEHMKTHLKPKPLSDEAWAKNMCDRGCDKYYELIYICQRIRDIVKEEMGK